MFIYCENVTNGLPYEKKSNLRIFFVEKRFAERKVKFIQIILKQEIDLTFSS